MYVISIREILCCTVSNNNTIPKQKQKKKDNIVGWTCFWININKRKREKDDRMYIGIGMDSVGSIMGRW